MKLERAEREEPGRLTDRVRVVLRLLVGRENRREEPGRLVAFTLLLLGRLPGLEFG